MLLFLMMLKGHPRSMYKYWDNDSQMQSKTRTSTGPPFSSKSE